METYPDTTLVFKPYLDCRVVICELGGLVDIGCRILAQVEVSFWRRPGFILTRKESPIQDLEE